MKIKIVFLSLILIFFTNMVNAQFLIRFEGSYQTVEKEKETFFFDIAYILREGYYIFSVGNQSARVESVPKSYSLFLLQKENKLIIPDISKNPMTSLNLGFRSSKLEITKSDRNEAGFMLLVSDSSKRDEKGEIIVNKFYLIDNKPSTIIFEFDQYGVTGIKTNGLGQPKR